MNLLLQDMQFPKIQPLWQSTTSQGVSKVARLELLAQIKLQGNITCMEPVRTSTSVGLLGMDSLLLSFSDAKMSLVEWSQACQNIVTVSIHFYEREEFKKESLTDKWIPTIRVDPQFRCATLSFYNDRLAVLPFKQDAGVGAVAGGDVEEDITSKYPFTPSFVISMATIDPKIRNVIDTAFLYDFFEPTLAILYETTQTWTGRLESKRDTKSVAVVSMDVTQKNFAILYVVDNLPYDCFKLVPVPSPVGGLLVFSTRGIIHVDQTSIPGVACAVNGYYGIETEIPPPPPPAPSADGTVVRSSAAESPKKDNPLYSKSNVSDYKHLGISLTGCMHLFLNPDTLLLILQTGEMLILELEGQDGVGSSWKRRKAGVRRFKMHRLGLRAMMPYCGTRVGGLDLRANSGQKTWARVLGGLGGLGGSQGAGAGVTDYGYLFIGSRIADSLLLQYSELHPRKLNKIVNGDGGDGAEQTEEKGRILSSFMDDEMEDIYRDGFTLSANDGLRSDSAAGGMVGAGSSPFRFRFRVCDTVICMGPIRDMAVGEPASQYSDFPFQPSTQRKDLEIVACIGEGPDGSLGIFQRNVRPQILSSFEIPDVTDMWTIRCVGTSTNAEVNAGEKTDDDGVYHKYLILSSGSGTMVLETGAELQEIEGTDLYRETPTVAAGTVLNESLVLQVHPNGILVLDSNLELIQVVDVGEEERWIVSCHIMDPYILLLMNVGDVMLYVADSSRTLRLCKEVKDAPISACCIYRDDAESQCFMTISEAKRYFQQSRRTIVTRGKSKSSQKGKGTGSSSSADMDDEDAVVLVRNPKKKSKKPKRRRENVGPDVMDMDVDQVDLDLYGAGDDDDDGDLYGMSTDEEEDEAEITLMDEDKSAPNGAEASEPSAPVDGVDVNNEKSNKTVESVPGTESVHIAGDGTEVTEENVSRVGVDGIGMLWTDRRYFCAIYWEDGSLGIYRIPDFQQCFFFPRFDLLPNLLVDQQPNNQTNEKPVNADGTASAVQQPEFDFNEILMTNIGRDESHRDAYLMARTEVGDLIIYRAFVYADVLPMRTPVTPLTKSKSADATGVQSISGPATFQDRLAIRFVRVQHDHLSREPQTYKDTEGDKLNPVASRSRRQPTFLKRHYLRPFTDIGTDAEGGGAGILYSGVFMGGFRPCWIMAAGTGVLGPQLEVFEEDEAELDEQQLDGGFAGGRRNANDLLEPSLPLAGKRTVRIHPAIADGEILSFSPFHNVNCPHGFMYINHQGSLRICRLLPQFMYDAEWPFCRVRLRRIPQKITYHHSSETYVVATSVPVPFVLARAQHAAAVAAGVIEEGDESAANLPTGYEDRPSGMYLPSESQFTLELVSPVTWETVDTFELQEYEHALAVECVSLESKQTTSGRKLFLAVGTGFVRGEDLATRGRILVFDIIEVVPEPDNPQTNHKLKLLYSNEEKSPVTAICAVNGYLLAAIGAKIIIHSFDNSESLTGVAFIDVNIYVTSVRAVKNLILVGDLVKSVWFLGFQEEPPKLTLLGKDFYPLSVYSSDFMVDNSSLAFVVSDGDKNAHILQYSPYNIQSISGQRLIRRGDIHIGSHVQKFVRLRRMLSTSEAHQQLLQQAASSSSSLSSSTPAGKNAAAVSKQHFVVGGTLDGGILVMTPVTEKLYKRLYALYSRMVNNLQHAAGLNPRGFRHIRLRTRPIVATIAGVGGGGAGGGGGGPPGPRSILDGDLLHQFTSLSVTQQKELAKAIGSSVERIMDDLLEVMMGVEFF